MNTYWLSDDETANEFWAHEWNTHGTCINTIEPSCYTDYTDNEEIGDFFQQVVDLFKTLDTYTVNILFFPHLSQSMLGVFLVTHNCLQALSDAGITPTDDATYTLAEIQDALGDIHGGYEVTLLCDDDYLYEVYYYFNVYGSAVNGTYEPSTPRKLISSFAYYVLVLTFLKSRTRTALPRVSSMFPRAAALRRSRGLELVTVAADARLSFESYYVACVEMSLWRGI